MKFKNRTFHLLQKADILTCYEHPVKRFVIGSTSDGAPSSTSTSRNCPFVANSCNTSLYPNQFINGFRCRMAHGPPIPSVSVAARSSLASPRTAAASDLLPPAIASSNAHVSPVVRRFSPAVAANLSATSSRFAWATSAAATNSPGCRPVGSAPAALGSIGNDDNSGVSSSPPAFRL